ncbi:MAG: DUF86 domain-containing protein [Chloroflexi bacterium]|nr:DUF86 domain-containing protein [Chloroflexota bacterium]
MKQPESLFLHHIVDAITRIEQYVRGLDQSGFDDNALIQDGVIRQIMIIGEAVKLLPDELRDKYIHIPWQDIAGMRDKLIHRYFGVDLEKVWLTLQDDLPVLKSEVSKILSEIGESYD